MVLARIQEAVERYTQWLEAMTYHPYDYEWELILHFQAHWNPQDPQPAQMFDRCLQNSQTRRPWQQGNWQPKRIMLLFWQTDPPTTKALFDDLFDETRDIEARIGRFCFGCDTLLADYKHRHPTSIENHHYHDDYRMIALYLGCRYPERYAFYTFEAFVGALRAFQARDIPAHHDLPRYFKMLRTLMTFIDKEPRIAVRLRELLPSKRCYTGPALATAADLCRFVATR
jgi:hypothetical protein